ncbi:C39 family peptidase [Planococcus halocryophilus]|uniref:C39 family peptidase n=1 Tax=Planococcus halocryophilus TaxID=1215089 RepID=UPI001F0D6D50|nr:C39 family peptidase [Planococcus halocryophilus]MCH4827681.1 C39 family peptidase [Planococcus halocryophilus]
MKKLIAFQGLSQYDERISKKYRSSACGPVTIAAILQHYEQLEIGVNQLYRLLGTTPIGLFTWRLVKNFRKIGGIRYEVKKINTIQEVKEELLAGRPLAMKFDRYFTFHWFSKPLYRYHWVPLIGFEQKTNDLILYIHDNGQKNRPSKLRTVSYQENQNVLTFVKIIPKDQL